MMKKITLVLVHLLLWVFLYAVLFVVLNLFISASRVEWILSVQIVRITALMLLPMVMIPFYAFYFLYIKLINSTNKWLWHSIALGMLLLMPLIYLVVDEQPITKSLYHNSLLVFGLFSLLGFLFRGFINGISDRQIKNELQRKQLESELTYLKAQLNPHFLFNTLNNIDSLIDCDPALASKSLINLSDIMRYMIYDSTENLVTLQRELDYLAKVINLNRLRHKSDKLIEFQVSGDASSYQIPPLLLLPIIENIFKHQSTKYSDEAILITLTIDSGALSLSCTNPYDETAKRVPGGGFGLQTLQRRLALLFPGQYNFEVEVVAPIFKVSLRIPLV
jgi:two-component system LytT family sensor kinase